MVVARKIELPDARARATEIVEKWKQTNRVRTGLPPVRWRVLGNPRPEDHIREMFETSNKILEDMEWRE